MTIYRLMCYDRFKWVCMSVSFLLYSLVVGGIAMITVTQYVLIYRGNDSVIIEMGNNMMAITSQRLIESLQSYTDQMQNTLTILNQIIEHNMKKYGKLSSYSYIATVTDYYESGTIAALISTFKTSKFALIRPAIAIGIPSGEALSVLTNTTDYTFLISNSSNNYTLTPSKTILWRGKALGAIVPNYNVTKAIWYSDTIQKHQRGWTNLYKSLIGQTGISASLPIMNDKNEIQAVLSLSTSIDVSNDLIMYFANSVSPNSIIYIVDPNGGILFSSLNETGSIYANQKQGLIKLIPATDVNNSVISETAREVRDRVGWSMPPNSNLHFTISIKDNDYMVNFRTLEDAFGLKWSVVLVVPEDDFFFQVKDIRRKFIYMLITDLLVVTIISAIICFTLNRSLHNLASSMNEIGNGVSDPDEFRSLASNTSSLLVMSEVLPIKDKFTEMLWRLADITETLLNARREAEQATQMVTVFLSRASHEMRTPLNGITPTLELILSKIEFDQDDKELINSAIYCSRMLNNLVDDVLDYSKLKGHNIQFDNRPFDLFDCVKNVMSMIMSYALRFNVNVNLNLDPTLPRSVFGDELRLSQVFTNLLTNAVKFANMKFGKVEFRLELIKCHNNVALIRTSIKDNGCGISQQDLEKLFVPFTQLQNHNSSRNGGTGLGLCISKEIAEAMQGEININSKLGHGTEVVFTFNIELQSEDIKCTQKIPDPEPQCVYSVTLNTIHEPLSEGLTFVSPSSIDIPLVPSVLIVDDNLVNCKILEAIVKRYLVCNISSVLSGIEAISLVSKDVFSCILMDMHMPEMDGAMTTELLMQKWSAGEIPTKPIIIGVTADGSSSVRNKCLSAGMTDVLIKPVNSQNLLDLLMKYIPILKMKD